MENTDQKCTIFQNFYFKGINFNNVSDGNLPNTGEDYSIINPMEGAGSTCIKTVWVVGLNPYLPTISDIKSVLILYGQWGVPPVSPISLILE